MCVFSAPPPPPPLPDPEPTAPKGEKTAEQVVTGQQRTTVKKKGQKMGRTAARDAGRKGTCLLYTSPSPRDRSLSRMPSSA